jgi:hypothetical protein
MKSKNVAEYGTRRREVKSTHQNGALKNTMFVLSLLPNGIFLTDIPKADLKVLAILKELKAQ